MKRFRAVDVPPKFRRTVKGRSARLGDSMYFNRCFSAYNLVYLKYFMIWVMCITLDFLIGFRFELLWPVWLLIRHLYESFRVHAFSSSLHYSAFSVFFVCVTATSDLVCYLFIPIQVLIFLASTYVWVQFVYQSSDRGVCLPSLFLWALFIVFEYSVRYRFDNATWYLARTSWITAGLFPNTADSVTVGSPSSTPSATSTRLELYRPFAAHCIGFPIVTLGFRVKSFFSNWRMRVRREEVRRQNEFYERILADAIPTSFENRKHFISSRGHLSLEQHEAIEYDPSGYGAGELLLNGLDSTATANNGQARFYSNASTAMTAAICGAPNTPTNGTMASPFLGATNTTISTNQQQSCMLRKQQQQQRFTKAGSSSSLKQQNGSARKNAKSWRPEGNGTALYPKGASGGNQMVRQGHQVQAGIGGDLLLSRDQSVFHKIWRTAFRFGCLFVLSTFGQLLSALTPSFRQTLDGLLAQFRGSAANSTQDDLISTSGDGSNAADEDEWDRESTQQYQVGGQSDLHGNLQSGKRKSRRPRGLSTLSQASTPTATLPAGIGAEPAVKSSASNASLFGPTGQRMAEDLPIGGMAIGQQQQHEGDNTSGSSNEFFREKINGELKHLQKEKQTLEQSMDKMRTELKLARHAEHELRAQLQQCQQQEQNARNEWKQQEREQRQKLELAEQKCRQLAKQNDHFKTNIQALEKRVGELQLKKLEIERELTNERLMKQQQQCDQQSSKHMQENGEHFKQKLSTMDRELKQLRREMKTKEETNTKLEEELRQLRSANTDEPKRQMDLLRQKNYDLEQTLSKENRLKQDLFAALNERSAKITALESELRTYKTNNQADMMNAFSSGNSLFHTATGGSTGSSPTQQQQPPQHFPTVCAQKSLTPPPYAGVATSAATFDMLVQATQNMSYSLGPIDSNGGIGDNNSYSNTNGGGGGHNSSTSSAETEMLAVGGHRSATLTNGGGKGGN